MIGGFSQGACLTAKYIMTYPAQYWGIFILSGALPGLVEYVINSVTLGVEQFPGVDLRGTRVLVGCGDSDPLIKAQWAELTAAVISKTGALVDKRIYRGLGHSICDDEKGVLRSWAEEISNSITAL
jgi:predicted esterase